MKSRVISVRLNPEIPKERSALMVLDKRVKSGLSKRQAITNALNHDDGLTPDMFAFYDEQSVAGILNILLSELRQQGDQIVDLLLSIKNTDPEVFRAFANAETDQESRDKLTPEFQEHLRNAARKSRKQLGERG